MWMHERAVEIIWLFIRSFIVPSSFWSTERMASCPYCFKLFRLTDCDRKQSGFLSFSWRTQMFKL